MTTPRRRPFLPDRALTQQILRFVLVGLSNTAIDFGLFNILALWTGIRSGWTLYALNAATLTTAMVFSYWANGRFTFKNREPVRAFGRFALVSLASMAVNGVLFALALHLVSASGLLALNAAKLAAAVFSGTLNFVGYRTLVYRPKARAAADPSPVGMLSVVIPAFNEAQRLAPTLDSLRTYLERAPWRHEVIVVDDGSTDGTSDLVAKASLTWPALRLIRLAHNFGKGRAVRVGIGAARGDAVLYTDADDSVSLDNLPALVAALEAGAHMAIGTRSDPWRTPDGEKPARRLLGRIYRAVVGLVLLPGYHDPQCGFKLLRRTIVPTLLCGARTDGFAFDAEFLVKAERARLVVAQVPVRWIPRSGSSVRAVHQIPRTSYDLARLALRGRDPVLLLGLLLAAVDIPVRLMDLWTSPVIGNEAGGLLLAYRIFHGSLSPLAARAHDIGPVFNDLIALLFHVLGPSVYLPRLFVMALSVGTVFLTFLLGRELFGRWVGLLASALLATCDADILVTHMAWSSDVTPFFAVLSAYLLVHARRRGGWLWVASALALAVAAQTDAAALALLPAFLVATWWGGGRSRLRDPSIWAGHGAFLLGYANVIMSGSLPWTHLGSPYGLAPSVGAYLTGLWSMLVVLGRSLLSVSLAGPSTWPSAPPFEVLLALGLLFYGLVLFGRRRAVLPLGVLLASLVLVPVFDRNYSFLSGSRFLDHLLPFGMLALALAVSELAAALRKAGLRAGLRPSPIYALPLALILILSPLPALATQYHLDQTRGATNTAVLALANTLKETAHGGVILLEPRLAHDRYLPDLLASDGLKVKSVGTPSAGSARDAQLVTPKRGVVVLSLASYHGFVAREGIHDVDARVVGRGTYVVVRLPAS